MKRNFLFVSLLLLIFLLASASPTGNRNFNRPRSYDVLHYVIRISFDRAEKMVFGDTTIELTPLKDALESVELDSRGLDFTFIGFEGSEKRLDFETFPKSVKISLGRKFEPGEKIRLRVRYSARPRKGIYFVDELVEKGKVVRSAQIWTQGESEETHHWLPSFDFPDDKATTEQILTVNRNETVIANGALLKRSENADGTATYHYRMDVPHSLYLTSFVIGEYKKVSDSYKDIPLGYYVYPGQESIVPLAYGKTKEMFRVFEDVTGVDYPYNKYDQTMVAEFEFGGMENITATTMADTEIMMARFKFGKDIVEDLVSHELAHSWFGNLVTCRNWAELWLNEGFATFMEAVFRERTYGRANYDAKIKQDALEYLAFESAPGTVNHGLFNTTADPDDDDTMFDTVTYQKGGAVIHTLREEIGENAFWKGVNLYLTRYRLKNVETRDLVSVMEEASGRDLDWFFDQWVYGSGSPKLTVSHNYDPKLKKVSVVVEQTHKAGAGVPEAFVLPLEIVFRTPKGPHTEKLDVKSRRQSFEFDLASRPTKLEVDPLNKIPVKTVAVMQISLGK